LSTENGSQPATAPQPTTVTPGNPVAASEISSLANYMARHRASSPESSVQSQAGEGSPAPAAAPQSDNREQFIPRSRFDEVLAERNQLRSQLQQPQAPQPAPVPQPANFQPQFGAVPQFQPQPGLNPTGMQGAQPPQPAANVPNWDDPAVQKAWREKIANNPVTGLREFVELLGQATVSKQLEQFRQQVFSQLQPLQQTFVRQQLESYATQRNNADPTFQQVAPTFVNLVGQAMQRGYSITPQVLQAIEGIARAQTGLLTAPPPPPQVPFSETPGGTGSFGQAEAPTLSPMEKQVAQRFGMTDAEYAQYRRTYG
jgi:hypothetical protein